MPKTLPRSDVLDRYSFGIKFGLPLTSPLAQAQHEAVDPISLLGQHHDRVSDPLIGDECSSVRFQSVEVPGIRPPQADIAPIKGLPLGRRGLER